MKLFRIILILIVLGFVAFSCWVTATSGSAQDVVSRRSSGVVSYTTTYDTVDANNRDGYSDGTTEALTYVNRSFVGNTGSADEQVGYQFALAIPQGRTIDSCYIFIYGGGDNYGFSATLDTLQWGAYASDNIGVFNATDGHALTSHASLVGSPIVQLVASPGTDWKSNNLASLLQSVVNRVGWTSGNYAGFVLYPKTVASSHDFSLLDYANAANYAYVKVVYH